MIPLRAGELRQRREVQLPLALVFKGGQRGVFGKDGVGMIPGKGRAVAQLFSESGDDPPVRFRLAGRGQKSALARDAAFGVSHRPLFLSPAERRKANVGEAAGVGVAHHFRDHHQRAGRQRLTDRMAVRERHCRVGAHDPHRLHLAAGNGVEQLYRHQPWRLGQPLRPPEARHPAEIVRREVHMRRQLIRQPADLAPAHRIGLTGQRKRPAAFAAYFAARQVDIDNGIALVAAAGGLVDPHGVERHRPRGGDKPGVKGSDMLGRQAAKRRHAFRRPVAGLLRVNGVQQADKQPGIAPRRQGQMQVGNVAGRGASRVNHHHLHCRVSRPRLHQALIEHRMGPGGVGAHQHHQVGMLNVLVAARNNVLPEGALVTHHRRGHAEPGVGVDIGRPDKAFHQLVGGVVILGQQLAGGIKGHRLRPVGVDDRLETATRRLQRLLPAHRPIVHLRMQESSR